jgi:phage shock protein A
MYRPSAKRSQIRPKISTMPSRRSETTALLDLYKLVVEKKRLQHELDNLEQRRQQISQRLAAIEPQISHTEATVQQLRHAENQAETTPAVAKPAIAPSPKPMSSGFDTMFLEY